MFERIEQFIEPPEIAEVTGLGINGVYQGLRAGEIPCRKVGRRYLVPREAFFAWWGMASCGPDGEASGRRA